MNQKGKVFGIYFARSKNKTDHIIVVKDKTIKKYKIDNFTSHIYPFGDNSLVWGDMYDQIMAFYFHMYDSFYDGMSLLFNPTVNNSISFSLFNICCFKIFI